MQYSAKKLILSLSESPTAPHVYYSPHACTVHAPSPTHKRERGPKVSYSNQHDTVAFHDEY